MERSISNRSVSSEETDATTRSTVEDENLSLKEIWKYSRTRRIAFWMKKSVRNVGAPNLNAIYEHDNKEFENDVLEEPIHAFQGENDESFSEDRRASLPLETTLDISTCTEGTPYYCANIDEAMMSLYSLPAHINDDISTNDPVQDDSYKLTLENAANSDPDDILDGDSVEKHNYPQHTTNEQQENEFGMELVRCKIDMTDKEDRRSISLDSGVTDGELTCVLAGMELETSSNASSDLDTLEMMDRCESFLSTSDCEILNGNEIENLSLGMDDDEEEGMLISTSSHQDEFECANDSIDNNDTPQMPQSPYRNMNGVSRDNAATPRKWDGIPDFLPFEDLSTDAGRFVRLLQVENEVAASGGTDTRVASDISLPPEFCAEEIDAFEKILESVPWEDDDDNDDVDVPSMEQDAFLIETLSSLDELSQNVTKSLMHKIKQKDVEIHQVLKKVQNVDIDVSSALSCTKQAQTYLQRVRGRDDGNGSSRSGAFGGLYIMEESDRRDKLRNVNNLLKSIEDLVVMEASVFDFVDDFTKNLMSDRDGLTNFLKTCQSLKSKLLLDESFIRLKCLDESRDRVSKIMEYSCRRIEEELMSFLYRRCKISNDAWNDSRIEEYGALVDARIVFGNHQMEESKYNGDSDSDDESKKNNFASTWSSCAVKALCFEADRCLPRALLDPTRINDEKDEIKSEFDTNLTEIKSKLDDIQLFNEDSASIRSLTMNLISIRMEFDEREPNIVGVLHKLCFSLAHVLHIHHKITEWHNEQIDDSCSKSIGTRCESPIPIDEGTTHNEDERIETMAKDDITKSTSSSNSSRSSGFSNHGQAQMPKPDVFPSIPQCISGPQNDEPETGFEESAMKRAIEMKEAHLDARKVIWIHCKGVLAAFLKTIITFHAKREQSKWSLTWRQDLQCFQDIYKLCTQFIIFGKEFIGDQDACTISLLHEHKGGNCELRDALCELFQKFVAGAHVEAMTEIGTMMASETWDLLPIPVKQDSQSDPQLIVQNSIHEFLAGIGKSISSGEKSSRLCHNQFIHHEDQKFSLLTEGINPFTTIKECPLATAKNRRSINTNTIESSENSDLSAHRRSLYDKVASYICSNGTELALGTKSALNGLSKWTLRLLNIQSKLPIVGDEIAEAISNIHDLYFLTSFRLCVGNSDSEAIILGVDKRTDDHFNQRFPQDLPPHHSPLTRAGTNPYKQRRRSSQKENNQAKSGRLLNILLSKHCEADINAPLKQENDETSRLRQFIQRGQDALAPMISLDNIEKWSLCHDGTSKKNADLYSAKCLESLVGASSSCLLVACILDTAISTETVELQISCHLTTYLKEMIRSILHMYVLSLRMCGSRAIMARRVVSNIIALGSGWAESRLNEHCNAYVDRLSNRYGVLWAHLSSSPLNQKILRDAWDHLVECGYLALLEGFSKVFDCSTEGRALMSMDLATFSSSINKHALTKRSDKTDQSFLSPPSFDPCRGMQYVDLYIKVFYLPVKDIQSWILENRHRYHLSHLLTLVSIGAHNQLSPAKLAIVKARRNEIRNMS